MQESGGRYGAVNPNSGALGLGQTMPATARSLSARLGLPYREDWLRSTHAQGRDYQDKIFEAAAQEAWAQGDPRTASLYYHGGSNRNKWRGRTNTYADQVMDRIRRQRGY